MNVKDKIILVTGGANGIGKALCERFYADGAEKIFVADLDLRMPKRSRKQLMERLLNLMSRTKKIANRL